MGHVGLSQFNRFVLENAERDEMHANFKPLLMGTTFARDTPLMQLMVSHKRIGGIYFLLLRHKTTMYKIYIGKTNSLANRLTNYVSDFQAHSPNDYKLRIFVAYLAELHPNAVLDLYFSEMAVANLKTAEKKEVQFYKPLLNRLPKSNSEAKSKLKAAFELYYTSALDQVLNT